MSKKKSCHVHNIFTINHTWLIIISSKNLWQINCGNGIAENVKKKKKIGNFGNGIATIAKILYIYIYIYISVAKLLLLTH